MNQILLRVLTAVLSGVSRMRWKKKVALVEKCLRNVQLTGRLEDIVYAKRYSARRKSDNAILTK